MSTTSRLWQIDARYMRAMQERIAGGLHPDAVDDAVTSLWAEWLGVDEEPLDYTDDGIALMTISGPLYNQKSPFQSNYRSVAAAIDKLLEAPPRAVVVRIDSPGGVVSGLDQCCEKLAMLAETTLVVAHIAGLGCSAAYRLAAQSGTIVAARDSEIGSIGTYWQFMDYSAFCEEKGIKSVLLTTGPFKGLGAIGEPITPEQIAFLQHSTDQCNALFLSDVCAGRGLTPEEVNSVADGRFWFAPEAQELKLIDWVGSLADVLRAVRSQQKGKNMPKETLEEPAAVAAPSAEVVSGEVLTNLSTTPSHKSLSDYMQTFGDADGARMFRDGVAWDAACVQAITELRGQLQDAKAECGQLKQRVSELGRAVLGEASALQISEEPKARKTLGEAFRAKK